MAIDWHRLRRIIDSHERFLITSHVRPDGDAIGSMLGLARLLDQKGKSSQIVSPSPVPPRYLFLDPEQRIVHHNDETSKSVIGSEQVLIILDTSAWGQLASMADVVRNTHAKKVVIDHHVGHDDLGADLFKDVHGAACGALLADAVQPLGCQLTCEVAEPLFVALATDTGWFRFASTNGDTLRIAGNLTDAGVLVDRMYRLLFEENMPAKLKLMSRTLDSLCITENGQVAHMAIRFQDLLQTGAVPQDSEDLINFTLSIRGVKVGLLFIEQRSGGVKASFRSRDGIDCTQLASTFGGGGHRAAAGATIEASLDDVRTRVLDAVREAIGG